jgi:hypothetical protein
MESNNHNSRSSRRLQIPSRSTDYPKRSPQPHHNTSKDYVNNAPKRDSSFYGFDDIPVENDNMEHIRFRDIIGAWARQAIKHSPIEKKLKDSKAKQKIQEMKNDLKWAMQADLDEPVTPRAEPSKPKSHQKEKPDKKQKDNETKTIDINVNFGALPKIDIINKFSRLQSFLGRNKKFIAPIAIVILGVIGYIIWPAASQYIASGTQKDSDSSPQNKRPDYPTVLPKDKSINTLGGWKRVSPDDSNPVFAYADSINNIAISVSQQPLPDAFRKNSKESIADLAKQFAATDKVDASGTEVYIGTSSKGPQSVIFTKNGLLVLIKSQQKANDETWISYVESLVGTDPSLSNY